MAIEHRDDTPEILEQLDLEVDGAPDGALSAPLAARLAADPGLAAERVRLARLREVLTAGKAPVAAGFSARVMEALPQAGWEARSPRFWMPAAALLIGLVSAVAIMVGLGSSEVAHGLPFAAAMAAVGQLFARGMVAGAGMLGASWRGVGLAIGEIVGASRGTAVALAGLGLGLNLLLLQLLRRKPAAQRALGRSR